jgi:hypothetical protein
VEVAFFESNGDPGAALDSYQRRAAALTTAAFAAWMSDSPDTLISALLELVLTTA